jgi:hypothetical protein
MVAASLASRVQVSLNGKQIAEVAWPQAGCQDPPPAGSDATTPPAGGTDGSVVPPLGGAVEGGLAIFKSLGAELLTKIEPEALNPASRTRTRAVQLAVPSSD